MIREKNRSVCRPVTGACALIAGLFSAASVQAASFEVGDVAISTTTSVSLGASLRTSGQDCAYISEFNGGCPNGNGIFQGVNADDGNVNAEAGDPISTVLKVTSEAQAAYRNFGLFVRGSAFYDYWGGEKVGEVSTRFGNRPLEDDLRGDNARDAARSDFELLDSFAFINFDAGALPVTVRVGNQVVNWGESLFIPNGINAYLPIDVAALRTPGSEVREALKPEPSIFTSVGLPGGVSLEGFYVFDFEKSDLEPCGTFFSTTDSFCDGGAYVVSGGEFPDAPVVIPRTEDREPDSQGQFGIAARYYADWLNGGTELAAYFNRYHSKLPIATFTTVEQSVDLGTVNPLFAGTVVSSASQFCGAFLSLGPIPNTFDNCSSEAVGAGLGLPSSVLQIAIGTFGNTKETFGVFVEDIETLGVSFNTMIDLFGGTAFAGEVAFTPDMPFQLADTEINANDLEVLSVDDYAAGLPDGTLPDNVIVREDGTVVAAGEEIRGYDEYSAWTSQLQTTSTLSTSSPITAAIDADSITLLGNVGMQYLPSLRDDARLAAADSGAGHPNVLADSILGQGVGFTNFASGFSWGYRLTALAGYDNFLNTPWSITPSVTFTHDVNGHSAGPIGPAFLEGRKAVALSVTADYESIWRISASYTNNFGAPDLNDLYDKDFLSINGSYTF